MAGNGAAVKVKIDHVVKKFNGRNGEMVALNGVDMEIRENEFVCVVGPSGCGKSTLLNILGTLDEPDGGEVLFEGKSMKGASAQTLSELRSAKIGFIFQLHHLLPQCTVLENVLIPTLALKTKVDRTGRAGSGSAGVRQADRGAG